MSLSKELGNRLGDGALADSASVQQSRTQAGREILVSTTEAHRGSQKNIEEEEEEQEEQELTAVRQDLLGELDIGLEDLMEHGQAGPSLEVAFNAI